MEGGLNHAYHYYGLFIAAMEPLGESCKRHTQITDLTPQEFGLSKVPQRSGKNARVIKRKFRRRLPAIKIATPKKPQEPLVLKHESPLHHYKMSFKMELGGLITYGVRKQPPFTSAHIQEFPASRIVEVLHWYRNLRHKSLAEAQEAFSAGEIPDVDQLSVIISMVLGGLSFLERQHFFINLDCNLVLLSNAGDLKIGLHKPTQGISVSEGTLRNAQSARTITSRLVYKTTTGQSPHASNARWSVVNSEASGFYLALKDAKSSTELLQQQFLARQCPKESLKDLIRLAQVSVPYNYQIASCPI
ncbi:hypothetical protein PG991_009019 [Apiospora marii]|uniref:Protein kinase domain-containing protein n=1 Tax=Apiospora marii TaxID=335849 RepID=A0ABR1RJJ3_9PEZI